MFNGRKEITFHYGFPEGEEKPTSMDINADSKKATARIDFDEEFTIHGTDAQITIIDKPTEKIIWEGRMNPEAIHDILELYDRGFLIEDAINAVEL